MKAFGSSVGDLHKIAPESVLHRLGGPAAVEATVDLFYDKVVRDAFLMPFFESTNLAALKVHQKHFMLLAFSNLLPSDDNHQVSAYLIKQHQRLFQMGLNETHFDRVAGHLVVSLHELQVKSTLIDEVVAILLPLRNSFQEGARKFGVGESKEESWSENMDVDMEEGAVSDSKQPELKRVIDICAEFNRRVRDDPTLKSLWKTEDEVTADKHQGIFQALLMDNSKTKEAAKQLLNQSGSLDSDDTQIELVANHLVAALQNPQEAARATCLHNILP